MQRTLFASALALAVTLSVGTVSLFGHHGRGATYESTKVIQLKGTVKQVLWRNPHIGILIDVKDSQGNVVTWAIEHSNVSTLARLGYGRTTLQPGMEVTAFINPGSKGDPIGLCQKIVLPDGKEVFLRGANNDPLD